jgi:hypothetical protein
MLIFFYCPLTIFKQKAEAARTEHASRNTPPGAPKRQPRVVIHPPKDPNEKASESSPMEVDDESEVSVMVTILTLINF